VPGGWNDPGSEDWTGVLDDWVSPAVDLSRGKIWYTACGGHNGSYNNGTYEWDAYRMCWRVLQYPSSTTQWSQQYLDQGSATVCSTWDVNHTPGRYDSYGAFAAKVNAGTAQTINDVYWDELFWDGKPTSRHTYQSCQYIPENNEIIMMCRRMWKFSLSSNTWTHKEQLAGYMPTALDGYNPSQPNSTGYQNTKLDGENQKTTYDEVAGEFLAASLGSGGGSGTSLKYNARTGQWGSWPGFFNIYADVTVTCRNGRQWVAMTTPGFGGSYNPCYYWVYDLDSRTLSSSGRLTPGAGFNHFDWRATDGTGLVYIPPINKYWMSVQRASNGRYTILEIDPNGWVITEKTFANAGPLCWQYPSHKLVYLPTLNAVVYPQTDGVPGSSWCLPMKIYRF
jgi:hypothetical protein